MTSAARRPRRGARTPSEAPRRRAPRRRVTAFLLAAAAGIAAFAAVSAVRWLATARAGQGRAVPVAWPADASAGASLLASAGVVDRPLLFRMLLAVTSPLVTPETGPHLLADDLSPAEVLRRLCRLKSRARVRLAIPEGLHRFQVGERLEALRVCSRPHFDAAATDRGALDRLGIRGQSAEGYLFPATYELFADTPPEQAIATFLLETKKRLGALRSRHPGAFESLHAKFGWTEHEVLTLASIVEKEARVAEERPIIASVFLNRLRSADFRPAKALQSDPTAAYGCLIQPELESCRGYAGRVLPAMLRDDRNPYNTYRHPGLPPSPIANPGEASITAVLAPAETDYLFFVATQGGRHVFSRTLEDHERAVKNP